MPRGVPNAKRDEVPLRFTLFNIPPQMNQKQAGSHYLRSEDQTLWGRNKKLAKAAEASSAPTEGRRGSNVIVIHPGTRSLRIGRATDVVPHEVPHVIARKSKVPVSPSVHLDCIKRQYHKRVGQKNASDSEESNVMDVDQTPHDSRDPLDPKHSPIALRERLKSYKNAPSTKYTEACVSFNAKVQPEVIPDHNDPYRVEWIDGATDDVLVGEKALLIADPHRMGYTVRWPLHGSRFNAFDYSHVGQQALLDDIEAIWTSVLQNLLDIPPKTFKDFSVVLIIPDLFERRYVRELANMLLAQMGFKQICVIQEGLSATFGAGISNACVIDAGAAKTSISIVDDGLVLPDTRLSLNMGGDDVTEFLLALLQRVDFPYREADLSRSYDWKTIEELKAKICTLMELDVGMSVYDVVVRRPGKQTEKYAFRAYDEPCLAPLCIFEPRVISFKRKQVYMQSLCDPEIGEDIVEQANGHITSAMIISTKHMLPAPIQAAVSPPSPEPFAATPSFEAIDPAVAEGYSRPVFSVAPQTAEANHEGPTIGQFSGRTQSKFISLDARDFEASVQGSASSTGSSKDARPKQQPAVRPPPPPAAAAASREIPASHGQLETDASGDPAVYPHPGTCASEIGVDVLFEAGKLPLDAAIFHSARAAGGDEKVRKYLQVMLIVGGNARVPGMAQALENRVQGIASPLVANMEKVTVIAPPRDVDPRVLSWKGGAVLGRMDAVGDLWVTKTDWDVLGMRSLKERSFFL